MRGKLYGLGFLAALLVLGLLLAMPAKSLTADDIDNSTIQIDVSQVAIVDITPNLLAWSGASPASIAACDNTKVYCYDSTGTARYGIEIENMGSRNITAIWLNTTFESAYPFASGNPGAYDAGNFVAVSKTNSTSRASYEFVNRVEYNATKWPIYLKLPANTASSGRFRDGNYEWFWALVPGAGGTCNETGAAIYISGYSGGSTSAVSNIHNETQDGDTDLTDNAATLTNLATNPEFGYVNVTFVTPEGNMEYMVLAKSDCSAVVMNHWNMDWSDLAPGTAAQYVWYQGTDGYLTPGNLTEIYVQARIPYGVHYGQMKNGVLTVLSTAQ